MLRKDFFKSAVAVAALSSLPFNIKAEIKEEPNKILPKRLKAGDTIGLIAPAGYIEQRNIDNSIKNISSLGFNVVYNNRILSKYGYLGGTDQERADDLNEMFSRKDVDGIFCVRGGWGCARILDLIDYSNIKMNPKFLIGFSDITSLNYALYAKAGLVTFHGPVGSSTFNEYSVNNLLNTVVNPQENIKFYNAAPEKDTNEYIPVTIRSGIAEGDLVGGNLSIVVSMIGTEYDINTKGKIIFLEEVREEPYRIDRMLTQMIQAGKFKDAAGVMLGVFSRCEANNQEESLSLYEVLQDRLFPLGIPVVYGMSFGHIANKITLPFGIKARLNTTEQSITFLNKAVL